MVLCKFFLQGTCKFGDNCKFEHQGNDTNRGSSTSILRQQTFPTNTNNVNNIDTNTLIRSVQNDMLNTEKGGQWLLSSYAPFKDKQAFPGFEDKCFEEVRFGFYEAKAMGTLEQYKQQLQMALQDAVRKIKALQNPSPEIVNIIKEIYNTTPKSGFTQQTAFSPANNTTQTAGFPTSVQPSYNYNNQNNKIFAQSAPTGTSNIFAVANQKLFGQNNSAFGNQQPNPNNFPTNGTFGQGNSVFQTQPEFYNKSVYNAPQQNSVFNQILPNQVFTTNATTPFSTSQTQNSLFSNMQTSSGFNNMQEQKPVFAQANTNFGLTNQVFQPTTTRFAQSAPYEPLNNPVFGTSNVQQSNFLNPQPAFVQTPNSAVFAQQVNPTLYTTPNSIYNTNSSINKQLEHPQTSNSVFGNNPGTIIQPNTMQNPFGTLTNQVINENAYSKFEDLSENDKKSFNAIKFELGQIPERPPTMDMCN